MNSQEGVDLGRRRLLTGSFLTDRVETSSEFGVSILECGSRDSDDDGVLWIDYVLKNVGTERTNVFVHLLKKQPRRSVKVLHLDPDEVFRGSYREQGKKLAEELFLEVEASSGTESQREVLKVNKSTPVEHATQSVGSVSILECASRDSDDDGVLWIDYVLKNVGTERTNVFVHLLKKQPRRSVKVLHLDPDEVFRGSYREQGKKLAEELFLEVEASSGTESQREVLKVNKSTPVTKETKEET